VIRRVRNRDQVAEGAQIQVGFRPASPRHLSVAVRPLPIQCDKIANCRKSVVQPLFFQPSHVHLDLFRPSLAGICDFDSYPIGISAPVKAAGFHVLKVNSGLDCPRAFVYLAAASKQHAVMLSCFTIALRRGLRLSSRIESLNSATITARVVPAAPNHGASEDGSRAKEGAIFTSSVR
jgi:hypothetical protein